MTTTTSSKGSRRQCRVRLAARDVGVARSTRRLAAVCLSVLLAVVWGRTEGTLRTGRFQAQFDERYPDADARTIARKVHLQGGAAEWTDYRIEEESFAVVVPPTYTHDVPHGLIVWISPGDSGGPPASWIPVLNQHKLMWIGANNSGNKQSFLGRRIPLAFDGLHNMRKRYNVDPERAYIAGHSGGGRTASMIAVHYSDLFSGAIYVNGMNYWEVIGSYASSLKRPSSQDLRRARDRGRYVLMTGDDDFNRSQTLLYYEQGYRRRLSQVLYLQVPQGGHGLPSGEWFEKAVEFLDGNITDAGRRITAELNRGHVFTPPGGTPPGATPPGGTPEPSVQEYPVRTWTAVSGHTVEAAFVREALGRVYLSMPGNPNIVDVPLRDLSPPDREYVRGLDP